MNRTKLGVVGLGMAAALGACGSSHHGTVGVGVPLTTVRPAVTPTLPTVPATATSTTTAPAGTVAPAGSTSPSRCPSSALSATLTHPNGTAGSVYWTLVLRNSGSSSCVLQGYPGVSFVTGPSGAQIGAAAARIAGSAPSVTLSPGAGAGAVLQVTDAGDYGSGCSYTTAAGLRVYPPDMTAALYVPHSMGTCANKSDLTLHIGAFRPA
jgi:hypothetical protein